MQQIPERGEWGHSPRFDDGLMMAEALEGLTDLQREVVVLVVAGFTQAEIAEALGVCQQRVSQVWSRATAKMQEFLV